MLSENIKKFRLEKNFTQEDLAIRLNVVRQTVSKWEKNRSVPDADQVIALSKLLGVSVNELLDTSFEEEVDHSRISIELEKANALIASLSQESRRQREANKLRGYMIFIFVMAILISNLLKSPLASILIFASASILSLIILYRNIALLTWVTEGEGDLKAIRGITIFNIIFVALLLLFFGLTETGYISFSQEREKTMALVFVSIIIIFAGIVSPRLPFNKHTGLRLPWTVYDRETWNLAHRIIGVISLPIAISYIAMSFIFENFEILSISVILVWIGIPSLISFIYYLQNRKG